MRFGTKCPKGFLPVFTVDTIEEAKDLIVLTCPTNLQGEYIAPELVIDQSLENLKSFGDRLEETYWSKIKENNETKSSI